MWIVTEWLQKPLVILEAKDVCAAFFVNLYLWVHGKSPVNKENANIFWTGLLLLKSTNLLSLSLHIFGIL